MRKMHQLFLFVVFPRLFSRSLFILYPGPSAFSYSGAFSALYILVLSRGSYVLTESDIFFSKTLKVWMHSKGLMVTLLYILFVKYRMCKG